MKMREPTSGRLKCGPVTQRALSTGSKTIRNPEGQTVLEMQGFEVVAMNGRDALARCPEGTPLDLFSDIGLIDDMSGIDVQRETHLHPKSNL
jgi:hypothetical protein